MLRDFSILIGAILNLNRECESDWYFQQIKPLIDGIEDREVISDMVSYNTLASINFYEACRLVFW